MAERPSTGSAGLPAEDPFVMAVSRHVWDTKYRYREGEIARDAGVADTWRRVAHAVAVAEGERAPAWAARFEALLRAFRFLPGGRILAGAGTAQQVTLFNCFVIGTVADSMDGIFDSLKAGAVTMQQGGGTGFDFSALRPRGSRARSAGTIASGPVSFMHIWDATCATILSTGARRGAMMATLRCDHPDIEEFVAAKSTRGALSRFNLSVQVTDAFMQAVRDDAPWPLLFPARDLDGDAAGGATLMRRWPGRPAPVPCRVLRELPARALWDAVLRASYDHGEPGVLFVDTINRTNNLGWREHITATNPCGEIPLPAGGACNLGSLNLVRYVREPFTPTARLDLDALAVDAADAVRLLDDVIDVSRFPLPAQAEQARGTRRVGLGVTGLADALIMLGLVYGAPPSLALAGEVMRTLCHAAYRASVALAERKGAFPFLARERYLEAPFVRALPADVRDGIARHGIRNSHLLAVAPTGTISLLANNVSSGIEPVYAREHERRLLTLDGESLSFSLRDHAWHAWRGLHPGATQPPPAFVDAAELSVEAHLAMQAAVQPFVDNAVSKTVNVPERYPFEDFRRVYQRAHELALKGCTTFRPNPVTGDVLRSAEVGVDAPHCCAIEREID